MTNINEICEAFAKGPSPGGYGYEVTHTCNLHNGHSGDHYASRHTHDGPAPHSHSWRECSERWCVLLNDHAEPHRNLSYEPITPGLATGTGVTAEEVKQIKKGFLALGGIDPDTPDTCGDTYRNVDGDAYARCALNPDHGGYHHCARHTWSGDHSWISTDTPLPTCSHHRIDLLGTTYTCERVLHHDGPHQQSATGSRFGHQWADPNCGTSTTEPASGNTATCALEKDHGKTHTAITGPNQRYAWTSVGENDHGTPQDRGRCNHRPGLTQNGDQIECCLPTGHHDDHESNVGFSDSISWPHSAGTETDDEAEARRKSWAEHDARAERERATELAIRALDGVSSAYDLPGLPSSGTRIDYGTALAILAEQIRTYIHDGTPQP
jgi:hypothetical protein